MTPKQLLDAHERHQKEIEEPLERVIIDTMRTSALPNTIAWVGVVLGSFLITLGLLVLVAG